MFRSEFEVLHYLWQLLAGLSHLHEQGIVHRDIKPDNLFIGPSGGLFIGDFGVGEVTSSG